MFDRSIFIRHARFSEPEFAALQALRTQYQTGYPRPAGHRFTERELAHLRFLHWLVRRPEWNWALDQPMRAGRAT